MSDSGTSEKQADDERDKSGAFYYELDAAQAGPQPELKEDIWSSCRDKASREINRRATQKLIEIVSTSAFAKLSDKFTKKKQVWDGVAEQMRQFGMTLDPEKGGEKCHQKWRNLERTYREYIFLKYKSKGKTSKCPPEFFKELHEVFGSKYPMPEVYQVEKSLDVDTSKRPIYGNYGPHVEIIKDEADAESVYPLSLYIKTEVETNGSTVAFENGNLDDLTNNICSEDTVESKTVAVAQVCANERSHASKRKRKSPKPSYYINTEDLDFSSYDSDYSKTWAEDNGLGFGGSSLRQINKTSTEVQSRPFTYVQRIQPKVSPPSIKRKRNDDISRPKLSGKLGSEKKSLRNSATEVRNSSSANMSMNGMSEVVKLLQEMRDDCRKQEFDREQREMAREERDNERFEKLLEEIRKEHKELVGLMRELKTALLNTCSRIKSDPCVSDDK